MNNHLGTKGNVEVLLLSKTAILKTCPSREQCYDPKIGKNLQKNGKNFRFMTILSDRKFLLKIRPFLCRNIPPWPYNCFKSLFPTVKL